jgi:hypothetical protein
MGVIEWPEGMPKSVPNQDRHNKQVKFFSSEESEELHDGDEPIPDILQRLDDDNRQVVNARKHKDLLL